MITFDKADHFKGEITPPSDKSITHRAILIASMADGVSEIYSPLLSRDTKASMTIMEQLGVNIVNERSRILIHSDGYTAFKEPYDILNCDNSGTTARLMAGILSATNFFSVLSGDSSLLRRPMARVIAPLKSVGAHIHAKASNSLMPLAIRGNPLKAGEIVAQAKSAQVKSAITLASVMSDEEISYVETVPTRDHTERMLKDYLNIEKLSDKTIIKSNGRKKLESFKCSIPADFSSAAFFIALGLIFEGSEITIKDCGLNETRTGFLKALETLGVKLEYEITKNDIEPIGNIHIKSGKIKGGKIDGDLIANMIDEVPLIALLGLFGESPLEIRDASELRVKESDRIKAIVTNFESLGAQIEEYDDGLKIYPLKDEPNKAHLLAFDDHRIVMINIILAKKFGVKVLLDNILALDVSYPDFIEDVLLLENK